jgi:hypothetical protein
MKSFSNFIAEMDASQMTTLHQQGINAHRNGHPDHKNPYREGSHEHKEWKRGWEDSKKEHEKHNSSKKEIKSPFSYTDADGKYHPSGSKM